MYIHTYNTYVYIIPRDIHLNASGLGGRCLTGSGRFSQTGKTGVCVDDKRNLMIGKVRKNLTNKKKR